MKIQNINFRWKNQPTSKKLLVPLVVTIAIVIGVSVYAFYYNNHLVCLIHFTENSSHLNLSITNLLQRSQIIKSEGDERLYRAVTLRPNGVRLTLISDADAIKSACAVNVHAGSFQEPAG